LKDLCMGRLLGMFWSLVCLFNRVFRLIWLAWFVSWPVVCVTTFCNVTCLRFRWDGTFVMRVTVIAEGLVAFIIHCTVRCLTRLTSQRHLTSHMPSLLQSGIYWKPSIRFVLFRLLSGTDRLTDASFWGREIEAPT
jgi:hypothetical protein